MPRQDGPAYYRDRARVELEQASGASGEAAREAHLTLAFLHLDRCFDGVRFDEDCPACDLRRVCGMGMLVAAEA